MKRLALLVLALLVTPAIAAEETHKDHPALANRPPAFERLKSLIGEWQGTGESHGTASFELVANGSAIMERLTPMGESPMINVYHADGTSVMMTHYCGSGNQPRMRCTKDGSSLAFTMTDITNWKKGEAKMEGLTLVLVDADHLREEWVSDDNGKKEPFAITMERKK